MPEADHVLIAVGVATGIMVMMAMILGVLLMVNTNRRHKHRAELAEMKNAQQQAVMEAERETLRSTLASVGRELHDNVGQLFQVSEITTRALITESNNADQKLRLQLSLEAQQEGISEIKRLGRTLSDERWHECSLSDAISSEANRLVRIGYAKIQVGLPAKPLDLSTDEKVVLYRVFQEVIQNALKHGEAESIQVTLDDTPIRMCISDNGKGFAANTMHTGSGLQNIEHRCKLIGFHAQVNSAPGAGCTWIIEAIP